MLSLSVVTLLLLAVTGAAVRAKFSRRSLIASIGVLEVLGLVLLGLPGAAFLETLQPVMQRLGRGPISADGAWPAAIMMSLVWPFAVAPAYLVATTKGKVNAAINFRRGSSHLNRSSSIVRASCSLRVTFRTAEESGILTFHRSAHRRMTSDSIRSICS